MSNIVKLDDYRKTPRGKTRHEQAMADCDVIAQWVRDDQGRLQKQYADKQRFEAWKRNVWEK